MAVVQYHSFSFPKISQNIPKRDFNRNHKRGNNDFPKNSKISQNFPLQVYFYKFSWIIQYFPKISHYQISHFVHRPGKIFPVRDIFPVISQNIPKQDLNKNPKRGNNDFPKNPKISQNFPPQVYFQETFSHIFPKNPKTGNQVFPNIPRFSHFGKYIPFCVRIPITGKLGKIAKMKLVRARPKLHSMVNIGK